MLGSRGVTINIIALPGQRSIGGYRRIVDYWLCLNRCLRNEHTFERIFVQHAFDRDLP
jgi:hypothetical protein